MAEAGSATPEAVATPTPAPETTPSTETQKVKESNVKRDAAESRIAAFGKFQAAEAMLAAAGNGEVDPLRTPDAVAAERQDLEQRVVEARREYAKAVLTEWRKGSLEQLSPDDLHLLAQDLVDTAERSAIAEMVISRHGFESAQAMMQKLGVKEVEAFGHTLTREQVSWLAQPAVKEHLAKLGISTGSALGVAAAITLLGGPVSWAAVGLGVTGAALGRLGGEKVRRSMLNRKVKVNGESERFNLKYAREMLETVVGLQTQAREAKNEDDPFKRTERILELLKGAASPANLVESQHSYKKTEKAATWIKGGLSVLGAIGGDMVGNALIGAAAQAKSEAARAAVEQQVQQAQSSGVWITHVNGHAQIVPPGTEHAHLVKEQADGLWHYVIQQKDASAAATKHLLAQYHYYVSPDQQPALVELARQFGVSTEFLTRVPEHLPSGVLFHAGIVNDVNSAFSRELSTLLAHINHDAIFAQWASAGAVSAGLLGSELAYNLVAANKRRSKERQVAADDRALLGSLDEVEEMLRGKTLLPHHGETPVGRLPDDPKRRTKFFEELARFYEIPVADVFVKNLPYNWHDRPASIDARTFDLAHLPRWQEVNREVVVDSRPMMRVDGEGKLKLVGIAGVNIEENQIAVVEIRQNEQRQDARVFPVRLLRLDDFLRLHQPIIRDDEGRPFLPPTAEAQNHPPEPAPVAGGSSEATDEAAEESTPPEPPDDDGSSDHGPDDHPRLDHEREAAPTKAEKPSGVKAEDINEAFLKALGAAAKTEKPTPNSEKQPAPERRQPTVKLPDNYKSWTRAETFEWLLDVPERVGEKVWEEIGGVAGQADGQEFIRYVDGDKNEHILIRSTETILVRNPEGRVRDYRASKQSVELFARKLLGQINNAIRTGHSTVEPGEDIAPELAVADDAEVEPEAIDAGKVDTRRVDRTRPDANDDDGRRPQKKPTPKAGPDDDDLPSSLKDIPVPITVNETKKNADKGVEEPKLTRRLGAGNEAVFAQIKSVLDNREKTSEPSPAETPPLPEGEKSVETEGLEVGDVVQFSAEPPAEIAGHIRASLELPEDAPLTNRQFEVFDTGEAGDDDPVLTLQYTDENDQPREVVLVKNQVENFLTKA